MHESDIKQIQMPKKVTVKETNKKQDVVVYIGPDFPEVKQYTTYNNGLPDALKEKIKEHPFFHSLIVPVEKLAQANVELAKEGSALNIYFRRAAENKK